MSAFDMILELIKNVKIGIMRKMEKKKMTQEDIMKLLDSCYEKCLNGIPMVSPGIEDMANEDTKSDTIRDQNTYYASNMVPIYQNSMGTK